MALKIYLDSNDYSRFAELHKQTDAIKGTFDTLTKLVSEGRIEVRYSSVNVLEAAPLTEEAIPLAIGRLNAIYRLCGRKCLIDVIRLLKAEANEAANVQVLSEIGDWNPVVYDLEIPDAATIARAILDKAKDSATPKQMRSYEDQFFDRSGKLKATARPRIVAFRKEIGAVPFTQYPLSSVALDTYYAFLLGTASRKRLTEALIESFADLTRWGEWYGAAWDAANSLTTNLRGPAKALADEIRRLAAMLKMLYSAIKKGGMQAKEIQLHFEEKANPDAMRSKLHTLIGSGVKSPRPKDAFSWDTTPAFETYAKVAMQIVRDSAIRVTMPRQTLDSDFVDCLHVCYSPFVDIFRADAYMVNVIERCRLPLKTQFVARLEDLPAVIASHPFFKGGS